MAIDKNPRKFILHVTEVNAELLPYEDYDQIEIIFHGKVMPSSKKRLLECVHDNYVVLSDKKMV